MIEVKIDNTQKVKVTVTPVNSTGSPAQIDGAVTFAVTSGDASTMQVDDTSAYLISGDTASESKILVTADADLGAGVETISEEISLVVSLPTAKSLGISVGEPEAK